MSIISELNLARKWRPSTFEAIVGQDLSVRLLKNSLFKQQFFPVYLLAGQRGCGKTTTGRIFAAAINCYKLDDFSQDPHKLVPCGLCASCEAMKAGAHPDFTEIDAASHTGVDNVRQIIEATSFMPHMGRKKIYLIDEAHMLSKAAFNAFLKILEEPPKTVLFMMATTDAHKIIDTVRSRCFQLFFDPISPQTLSDYLAHICEREKIPYDTAGLGLIVQESEGSARDALNLIERVRLAYEMVTKEKVLQSFGSLEEAALIALVEAVAQSDAHLVLRVWQEHQFEQRSAQLLWKKLFDCLRGCLMAEYGTVAISLQPYAAQLQAILKKMSAQRVVRCMEMMCAMELQFLKSTQAHAVLEVLLLKMCFESAQQTLPVQAPAPTPSHTATQTRVAKTPHASFDPAFAKASADRPGLHPEHSRRVRMSGVSGSSESMPAQNEQPKEIMRSAAKETQPAKAIAAKPLSVVTEPVTGPRAVWQDFVARIDTLPDPLLGTMIKQGFLRDVAATEKAWHVDLPKKLALFEDTLQKHASAWQALFAQVGGKEIELTFHFTKEDAAKTVQKQVVQAVVKPSGKPGIAQARMGEQKKSIDVSDSEKWETTHTLLSVFPGTVTVVEATPEDKKNIEKTGKGQTHE